VYRQRILEVVWEGIAQTIFCGVDDVYTVISPQSIVDLSKNIVNIDGSGTMFLNL